MKLAKEWLTATRAIMDDIEATQTDAIQHAAELMAESIAAERWVHTFGCGHATIPVEEMYPRIGGFVGFHPMIELPLTFFTRITGEMGPPEELVQRPAEHQGEVGRFVRGRGLGHGRSHLSRQGSTSSGTLVPWGARTRRARRGGSAEASPDRR